MPMCVRYVSLFIDQSNFVKAFMNSLYYSTPFNNMYIKNFAESQPLTAE